MIFVKGQVTGLLLFHGYLLCRKTKKSEFIKDVLFNDRILDNDSYSF